jgi:hypothetical protein
MSRLEVRKRRHHYVWRRYLRAWSVDEKIFASIEGKIVNPNLMGVAQERDFYRFKELTEADVAFVHQMIDLTDSALREQHRATLNEYLRAQRLLAIAARHAGANQALDRAAAAFESNFIEDWHGSVEATGEAHLVALAKGDMTFAEDKSEWIDFCTFLATQYFRTRRQRDRVLQPGSPVATETRERTWPLLVHLMATNMAWHLLVNRDTKTLRLLTNVAQEDFITSDQPVVNLHASPRDHKAVPMDSELFYPVTPRTAVLLGRHNLPWLSEGTEASAEVVDLLNEQIVAHAERQLFARSKSTLSRYVASEI